MDGIGFVRTSSPTSSITSAPLASYAATDAPSVAHDSSPSHTGTVGARLEECGAQVGSARHRADLDVLADPIGDPAEAVDATAALLSNPTLVSSIARSCSAGRSPAFRHA